MAIEYECHHPDDRDAWRTYWKEQGQPWRTEPEIDPKRQFELSYPCHFFGTPDFN